jgi:serine phosphatase RsbU (regulator of sigma subunit)
MGKGMPAAIVMATVRAAVRSAARTGDVGEILSHAGASAAPDLEQTTTFATVFIARLGDGGEVSCADAGHGHAVVVRADGTAAEAGPRGFPLGIDAGETYGEHTLTLERGDLLIVHSDGLLELPAAPRSSTDVAPLVAGASSAREAVDRLLVVPGAPDPPDDVTIVAVRRSA